MSPRIYRLAMYLTGGVGLATTIGYVLGAALTFVEGMEAWRDLFVPLALPTLLVPIVTLLVHLYLRSQLGAIYLRAGHPEATLAYTEDRLEASFARSRREVTLHRLARARALAALGRYRDALVVVQESEPARRRVEHLGEVIVSIECLLRLEDLVAARELYESSESLRRGGGADEARADLYACGAELWVRADDEERCAEALESAIWIAPTTARVAWSRVLATHAFRPQDREEIERAIELLDDARGELDRRLGLRAPELAAVCAELHHRLGRDEAAREIVERAAELPADDRARSVLAATRARIEPAEDSGDDAAGEDEAKSAAANGR